MAGMFKDVSQTVKAGARNVAIVGGLGLAAAIFSAVALLFIAYAAFDALRLAMPAWAAALIIAVVLAIIVAILCAFIRSAAQTIGEAVPPEETAPPSSTLMLDQGTANSFSPTPSMPPTASAT